VRANQVWSWGITYLPTVTRGRFLRLYLVMDVWSRRIVGWEVHDDELAERAATLIHRICAESGVDPNGLVPHSDNGEPMRGNTMVATLQWLGIVPSFSRPDVCNDNPYSEALFRTLNTRQPMRVCPLPAARGHVSGSLALSPGTTPSIATAQSAMSPRRTTLGCRCRHPGLPSRALRAGPATDAGTLVSEIRNWTLGATVTLNPEPSAARIDAAS